MELTIKATPKEIAALVLALQGQRNQEAVEIVALVATRATTEARESSVPAEFRNTMLLATRRSSLRHSSCVNSSITITSFHIQNHITRRGGGQSPTPVRKEEKKSAAKRTRI